LPSSFPSVSQSCTAFGTPVQLFVAGSTNDCEPNSVKEISNLSSFALVPNPTNNIVVIKGELLKAENVTITLTDVLGKVLVSEKALVKTNRVEHSINVSDYASGIYMVHIETNNAHSTLRLIKE
jgi:hypothetical protein